MDEVELAIKNLEKVYKNIEKKEKKFGRLWGFILAQNILLISHSLLTHSVVNFMLQLVVFFICYGGIKKYLNMVKNKKELARQIKYIKENKEKIIVRREEMDVKK